ncbi:MAG TPA: hypothetical protein VFE46_16855 [Pirellulales bacterium]|jgi:hypothetical protein|nr:hypothetical protein [Pirellulales bacterium]
MHEIFSKLNGEDLGMMIMILAAFFIALTAIVGGCVVKVIKSNNQTKLKQNMLEHGMSADEIKAVLDAGKKS